MSIYATQWILKFPKYGDAHSGCEWVTVIGQGVPAHIGTPTFGYGLAPLLVLSGEEYQSLSFQAIHDRICDALRGDRLRVVAEMIDKSGSTLILEDGTVQPRRED